MDSENGWMDGRPGRRVQVRTNARTYDFSVRRNLCVYIGRYICIHVCTSSM